MGWIIEYRAKSGKMVRVKKPYSSKLKADVALRGKLYQEHGRVWLTSIEDGTKILSSVHSNVLGLLIEFPDKEVNVDEEFHRRMREYHETNRREER